MDLFFLFFRLAPAMKLIFKISYIPTREDFKELTPAQYRAMYAKVPEEDLKALANKKVFALLPDDIKVYNKVVNVYGNDLAIVSEDEVSAFEAAADLIEQYCNNSGKNYDSLTDKLVYMAQTLPSVFSEGTPYAIHGKIRKPRK